MASSSRDVLGRLSDAVPPAVVDRLADERSEVAPAGLAATVVLLRDHDDGLQTYALHRHNRMPFAPGMVVFPGGRLDPADGVPVDDHDLDDLAVRHCAVRETEEETGVRLRPEDLQPWARWITPEIEPRRYDTAFYLAAMPAGQTARDISGETSAAGWQTVRGLLAAADDGEITLMPPTRATLLELADHDRLASALAVGSDRLIEIVMPRPVHRPDGGWVWSWEGRGNRER
ncbi:NUDIX hydrolase [Microlunatus soli]|uniref:NUDIX domain-containing protein n=1 Tax=Microlunatus soli TaxID=630515 RepID=A0A1H1T1C7_9ACTN|nr:NUDIX domain-containing protein [Microlunatus soli]SDS54075.1 NUDIX domain-containing protein [Microlunatus soli]